MLVLAFWSLNEVRLSLTPDAIESSDVAGRVIGNIGDGPVGSDGRQRQPGRIIESVFVFHKMSVARLRQKVERSGIPRVRRVQNRNRQGGSRESLESQYRICIG